MRKILTTALAVALTWVAASAVPAKRTPQTVTQSDGTQITVTAVGDEWHHSLVTTDGLTVERLQGTNDFYYRDINGITSQRAHNPADRTPSELSFLTINKNRLGVKSTASKVGRAKRADANVRRRAGQTPSTGNNRVPIILVQYQDIKFKSNNDLAAFTQQYQTGSKSAKQYFVDQSNSAYIPQYDIYGPYTLSGNRADYGGNSGGSDKGVGKMVLEAISMAGNSINWANYDNDNNNEADVCIVVYAGVGEAQASTTVPESIWPCQWTLSSANYYSDGTGPVTRNGKKIDKFAVFNELNGSSDNTTTMDGVGTFCHEFSHCLGLPDFYETNDEENYVGYYGMDEWSLMDYGCYNDNGNTPIGYNAYEKEFMGWHTPTTPVENHNYTLSKWNTGNDVSYKITSPLNSNERYYLENRVKQGWDAYIKDEGMLVTHVTYVANAWSENEVNNDAVQLCTIIPADNKATHATNTADCFGESKHELTDTSTPAATLNMYANGSRASTTGGAGTMNQPLTDIYINSSDKSVSFWYMKGNTTPLDAPELADASNITTSGWTASWTAVTGAASYTLQIDPVSGGGSSSYSLLATENCGKETLTWNCGSNGFTKETDYIQLGSNKNAGNLTSRGFNFSGYTKATIVVNAKGNTGTSLGVTVGSQSSTISGISTSAFGDHYAVVDLSSESDLSSLIVKLSVSSGASNKVQIATIKVYAGDASSTLSSAPRRAGATSRTITDITGTSYTVTGMADDQNYTFKVRAVPATTDAEHSTGDWSNVKTVKTEVGTHEPSIAANETMDFGSIYVDATKKADLEIVYDGLTAPITATITGNDEDMFSCDGSITVTSAGYNETTLTVTYSPTAAGTHTATLTLSSTGADPVTCTLTGTATLAPLDTYNPVMQDATGVTTSAFTATWTDQTDAEAVASYTLYVNKKGGGQTTTYAYQLVTDANTLAAGDEIIVTNSKAAGSYYAISTDVLSTNYLNQAVVNIASDGTISTELNNDVEVFVLGGSVGNWYLAASSSKNSNKYLCTASSTLKLGYSNTLNNYSKMAISIANSGVATMTFVDGATDRTIEYYSKYSEFTVYNASSANVYIFRKTAVANSAPRRAVATSGDADNGGLTISGITDKTYAVTGLTPGQTYEFKVKAIYTNRAEAAESAWSNVKEVKLPESTNPRFTFDTSALSLASDNNSSDTKTFTLTGEYLTAGVGLSISGTDAVLFSVSPANITPTNGNVNSTITVTYTPTTAGNHSATLTVSSTGADSKTIALTGTATLFKGALTLNDATAVTQNSFTASWEDATLPASNVASYTLYVNKTSGGVTPGDDPTPTTTTVDDVLDRSTTGVTGTSYSEWSGKSGTSGAVYAGQSAGGNSSIQLRSKNSNSGIVTTTSGGTIRKVTVTWNSNTANGNKIDIYGSNSAYTNATQLYSSATQGTLLGSIVYGTSTELEISGDYTYIGVRSNEGAVYLTDITFTWEQTTSNSAPRREVATSGDADNGGLTVTGITDKEYTVTGLTPGATYEFKVKAVYTDESESAYTAAKSVTTEQSSDPRLIVEPLALSFTNVKTGATAQQTFTVTGTNLTGDVTVAVGEGMFTVSPTTISAADAAEGATVTVTYAPTAFGNHTATVTLTSAGAEAVSVELSGSAVLEKAAPVMAEAVNATATSFKAVWTDATPAANVRDYTLYVNKTADPVTPGDDELVTLIDGSAGVREWASTGNVTTNSVEEPYLQLGTSKGVGGVESDEFTLDAAGKVTVVVVAKPFTNDVSKNVPIKVSVGTSNQTFTLGTTGNDETLVAVLDAVAGANTLSVEATTKSSRPWIKSVMVYKGDVSAQLAAAGAPRRVVATSGDADNGGLKVTGITDKEYTVTGLTPGATYEFYVEANYVDDTKSESNHEDVVLPAGTSLAEVLESESGSYTISDNLVIVAVLNNMAYATNGTDWLPINVESGDNFKVGDKITLLNGTFNGSVKAPLFTLTECGESTAEINYSIADFYLGQDWTTQSSASAVWERMPAAGEVVNFYGYYFLEGDVPTLRGYSGTTGTKEKGRSLILLGDNYGTLDLTPGKLYQVEVCVQLAEAWSGAPRRIASGDADAYQNLRGQVISTEDLTQTGIDDIIAAGDVQSVRYINAAGQMSSEPFAGLNIIVTTLTDGTVRVAKVLK